MSSEGDSTHGVSSEKNKTVTDNDKDISSEDSQDEKKLKIDSDADKKEENEESKSKLSNDKREDKTDEDTKKEGAENNQKDSKGEQDSIKGKTEKKEDTEGDERSEKDEDKKDKENAADKSSQQSNSRDKKKGQKINEDVPTDGKEMKTDIPSGNGIQLGEIPRIDASISRFKNDDLKMLHRLLFKVVGKTTLIKKNIKKFNGFDFKKDSDDYSKKIEFTKKFELKQLKVVCEMLDLEKKGSKDEIVERIVEFLLEPKDSGKATAGGRPKRTAAVRANNRGYSSHDDSYSSDEQKASRTTRGKGKRTNLKDDSTSESDFHLSDASDEKPKAGKRKKGGGRKKALTDEEELSEVDDSVTSEDSDVEPKKRKKAKKVSNNKTKAKATPKTRGRKPAVDSEKKTPAKRGRKPARESSEESEQEEENASSSEDEPLIKKAKSPQPPTDEDIKKYVKEILDGANLEEITMKTVCKQVYAHYPDFDLAHKKDFIKTTVKSLIST